MFFVLSWNLIPSLGLILKTKVSVDVQAKNCSHVTVEAITIILFDGQNTRELGVEQWCGIRTSVLSLMPQDMALFPELTVAENIDLKNKRTNHKSRAQILEMLERMGLADKYNAPANKLSIGQMQRVALVRSVCQPFSFIFLDEPVSHLDSRNNRLVAEMISGEAERQGAGIVATSVGNHLLLDNAQFISL